MKKDKVLTILLVFLYLVSVGIILYVTPVYDEENYIVKENDYTVVEVKNLADKISNLDFKNKTRDDYKLDGVGSVKTNIFNGKVTVTLTINGKTYKYIVGSVLNVVSTRSNISKDGKHVTYMLTGEGKVFRIEDDLKEVIETENYKGTAKDMGIINVLAISINQGDKFSLDGRNKEEDIKPSVYILASENRLFTDEKLSEKQNGIVEIVLKNEVVENKKK